MTRTRRGPTNRSWRIALYILVFAPLAYLIAAVAGALIPANPAWRPPPQGTIIFVQTNGVHTSIVVPAATAGIDWTRLIRAEHIARPDLAGDHFAIGWGQREFFLKTPTWADLKPDIAIQALFGGGGTLMHVEHLRQPTADRELRPILVSSEQYRRLSRFILDSFHLTPDGRLIPIHSPSATETFYEARGTYHLFATSNEWTGAALRAAGIRVGIWTPFAQSVLVRFPIPDGRQRTAGDDVLGRPVHHRAHATQP